jgi:hypothetical protein
MCLYLARAASSSLSETSSCVRLCLEPFNGFRSLFLSPPLPLLTTTREAFAFPFIDARAILLLTRAAAPYKCCISASRCLFFSISRCLLFHYQLRADKRPERALSITICTRTFTGQQQQRQQRRVPFIRRPFSKFVIMVAAAAAALAAILPAPCASIIYIALRRASTTHFIYMSVVCS